MRALALIRNLLSAGVVAALSAGAAYGQEGDPDNGEAIYYERCAGCHGEDGDGLGPGADRLNPPPRDFTMAQYKIVTTGFDDIVPNDGDLFRMIADGMPGTSMPGWSDVLTDSEINDLIAWLLYLGGLEEEVPATQVDYGDQIPASAESIEAGRQLFLDDDRCSECHGQEGRGNGVKRLRDDNGDRTWPRNLTRPDTFRGSNDPQDIFARITVGIAGTEMPSFDDPRSEKRLTIEERWHVANFVSSLAETEDVVDPENTVIVARRVTGDLPTSHQDAAWIDAPASTFYLVPQILTGERLFTPTNDRITIRSLYNDASIAFLLKWDDRTRSLPGDPDAEEVSEPGLSEDAVRIQLPVEIPAGMERPYLYMGDSTHTVNLLGWTSGTADTPGSGTYSNSDGALAVLPREANEVGLTASGEYENGTWHVVLIRDLSTAAPDFDLQFEAGSYIPIAFGAWDGSNAEGGSRHTITTWYWLILEAPDRGVPIIAGIAAAGLAGFLEFLWLLSVRRRREPGGATT